MEWTIVGDRQPVLTAGPDVRFELVGLDPVAIATARGWEAGQEIDAFLGGSVGELRDLLVGVGAIRPRIAGLTAVALVADGAVGDLVAALNARGTTVVHAKADPRSERITTELTLVVRRGPSWPTGGPGVHLGIDLSHHHTLVLGPLVVPGVTSCLDCLERHIERRWGSDDAPAEPAMLRWSSLVAELVTIQLELIGRGRSPLVNATASWNLSTAESERHDLLRAPDCGGPCRAPSVDKIHLPWLQP
ncbi:MAG: hypothetical protein ACI8TP_000689 [Acidimicrobiales bacterium]|jgi:hypothetical protein